MCRGKEGVGRRRVLIAAEQAVGHLSQLLLLLLLLHLLILTVGEETEPRLQVQNLVAGEVCAASAGATAAARIPQFHCLRLHPLLLPLLLLHKLLQLHLWESWGLLPWRSHRGSVRHVSVASLQLLLLIQSDLSQHIGQLSTQIIANKRASYENESECNCSRALSDCLSLHPCFAASVKRSDRSGTSTIVMKSRLPMRALKSRTWTWRMSRWTGPAQVRHQQAAVRCVG
jgi:hypothetical protein